jgi:hypothetical protein
MLNILGLAVIRFWISRTEFSKQEYSRSISAMDGSQSHLTDGNIRASEQRKRLLFGVIAFAAGVAWVITGRATSFSGAIVLLILFWFGALGFLQAKEKT